MPDIENAPDEMKRLPKNVLYEELAEYYYRSISSARLSTSNVQQEIEYHLKNVTLLGLYFDSVLLTSATLFNVRSEFVDQVIKGFMSSPRVRDMLRLGALKIVGWGGDEGRTMFDAAKNYAGETLEIQRDKKTLTQLRSIFESDGAISRDKGMPDADLARKYIERLAASPLADNKRQLTLLTDEVERQRERTNSLIAVEILPSLDTIVVSESDARSAKLDLFGVSIQHMRDEIPGLWVYSPFWAPSLALQANSLPGSPSAFLLSPMIFGSFLRRHIGPKTFTRIMSEPYAKLHRLKNGDWARFSDAYHAAVADVSEAMVLEMHLARDELISSTPDSWATNVSERLERDGGEFDVATFVESLANIGGVLLTIPILKPAAKLFIAVLGQQLSDAAKALAKRTENELSPFIVKVENAYTM